AHGDRRHLRVRGARRASPRDSHARQRAPLARGARARGGAAASRPRGLRIATTVGEAGAWRATARGTIGLVPTMGYLHAGHLSLVERCRTDNDWAVASL